MACAKLNPATRGGRAIFVLMVAAALSTAARAVPIPFLNCGAAGDTLQIQQMNANIWPPLVAAPANATATFDPQGNLVDLQVYLLLGVPWTFDSGPLPTTTSAGFVSLPASFAASVTSPALPLAAGPYTTTQTFGSGGSETILSKANLAATLNAPASATVSLLSNGTAGFPLSPVPGNVYRVQVQVNAPGGGRVFCIAMNMPLAAATPFVGAQATDPAPTLSSAGLITLALMLLGTGWFASRRRTHGPQRASRDTPRPPAARGP